MLNMYNFIYVDLKAFERRLTDVIAQVQPVAVRWRGTFNLSIILYSMFISFVFFVLVI